ncbi:interferon-inducible double-stranded RNA-dependent protein kinase activator A isoform X2 [Megachile rotundata]|uniref:interferon-inducible double-stranded RNA-dependent protein kinase activator A isoform X2 n=1 Tax=Megachile rotundata TaxID=143995 RepID=UPI0006154317|nr:PREDICTED: interferon-inducible double-stranded RNA-dependent protein kinase activator A-like isoform X2 [Megachile rotundata]
MYLEMMVKKHTVPNYELIHDGGGTHMNTFTYKVICDGLTATGTGRSKKDAKHEAAKAMLETIAAHRGYPQLPASPAQSPVRTPLPPQVPEVPRIPPTEPFVNAIGALQDLCAENNLQEPLYVPISDVGPPHAKIFTIQCEVSTFKEIGVAKTKKQAKQEAAKKMLDKISDLVANQDENLSEENDDTTKKENIANELAKARYPLLSRLPTKKVNLGVKLSEYHIKLKNSFPSDIYTDLIEKLESFIPKDKSNVSEEYVETLLSEFSEFLSTLGLNISNVTLESNKADNHVVLMKINTFPEITQISCADTDTQARFFAIINLINTMLFLLK